MCLDQGQNAVTLVGLEPTAIWSGIKHSTTEPLLSPIVGIGVCGGFYACKIAHPAISFECVGILKIF